MKVKRRYYYVHHIYCFYADSVGSRTASGCKYSFRWSARLFVLAGAAARFGYATEINETERVRFTPLKDGRGKSLWSVLIVKKEWHWVISNVGMACIGHWRSSLLHHFLLWAREALAFPMAQRIIPTPYLRSSAKIAKKSLLTIRVKDNYSAYKSEHMKPPFDDDFAC